jgi:FkbM family methyltransferase
MAGGAVLHRAANAIRKGLVATGGDRLVASGLLWSRLRPDNAHYRAPAFREATLDGVRFQFDLSDYMQWSAYFGIERELRDKLYSLAPPGGLAIDIGTNIGEVLLHFARRVGNGGRAIGFEPNPETYARCVENLALNPGLAAEVHPIALGDAEGELSFGRPCAANSGGDRMMDPGAGTIQVPVTTLDRFVSNAALDRVDLIKIDVEGFEMHVLRGGEATIERFRPKLFVELSHANLREQGASAPALVRWLDEHGYAAENAETGEPVNSCQALDGCFFDIICRPR